MTTFQNQDNLLQAADAVGRAYIIELTNQLISADKKASGDLINSLDYEVIEVLGNILIRVKAESYLKNVDQGRKKGNFPPVGAIEKWVKTKRIQFKDKKGKFTTYKSTAFAVARGIQKNGIKPTKVLDKAKKNILSTMKEILLEATKKDIKEYINKILTE